MTMVQMFVAFIIGFGIIATQATAQVVVSDPIQQTLQGINNQVQTAHATFMKLQMVQDAIILKNNFIQAESYYKFIDERSKHRGGLVGYYKQMVEDDVKQIVDEQKMDLEYDANNITGPTLVNDFAAKASAAASQAATDAVKNAGGSFNQGLNSADSVYGDTKLEGVNLALRQRRGAAAQAFMRNMTVANAAGTQIADSNQTIAKTAKALTELEKQANSSNIDDKAFESLQLGFSGLTTRLAVEQSKLLSINTQLAKALLDSQNVQQAFSRQASADYASFMNNAQKNRAAEGADANAVNSELKRMPSN